jgi:hypothetical protein
VTTSNHFNVLADKVWFTRKAWIQAEKRLLNNEAHTQKLMVLYSVYTTCISVALLKYTPEGVLKGMIDVGLAVLSIALLTLSLYLNTQSFKDRAARFKSGYLDLDCIEHKLRLMQSPLNTIQVEFIELSELYNKTLRDVENHSELDDIRSRIKAAAGLTSRRPRISEYVRYYWWRVWRFSVLTLAYLTPMLFILFFYYSVKK